MDMSFTERLTIDAYLVSGQVNSPFAKVCFARSTKTDHEQTHPLTASLFAVSLLQSVDTVLCFLCVLIRDFVVIVVIDYLLHLLGEPNANYWILRTLFIVISIIVIEWIRTCLRVSSDRKFLWFSLHSCPMNWLLVWTHPTEIIILKRLNQILRSSY